MRMTQKTQDGETVEVTLESEHVLCISDAAVSALESIVGALAEEIEVEEECDNCGASGELSRVSDCDSGSGYHSTLLVCRKCFSARASRRISCGSCG